MSSQNSSHQLAISPVFFDRSVLTVAEGLLGKVLVRVKRGEGNVRGIITEVEAYDGPEDKASHAHRGRTKRNAPMFGPAGHWYVYLVYGMHWMLNIVTGPVEYPAAVLIRGVQWSITRSVTLSSSKGDTRAMVRRAHHDTLLNGPGKLTKALHVDQTFNALPATKETGLWIEDHGINISQKQIRRVPRIGVDYAGVVWAKKPYRFVLALPITLLFLTACTVPVPHPIIMQIVSPAFIHNQSIPAQYTCDGANVSPPLRISGVPTEAKSLVLIHDDPDAPAGTWVHWLLWNVDPRTKEIPAGGVPEGAVEGTTSFRKTGYGGPCPPSDTHRYFFKLYALDTVLALPSSANRAQLEMAMRGHVLAQTELIGIYQRTQ